MVEVLGPGAVPRAVGSPPVAFDAAARDLADHVVGTYLDRKLANMFGVPARIVTDRWQFTISSDYKASEGKIKGSSGAV